MDKLTIQARLIEVAAGKRKHAHYDRTVERAKYYRALSTGAGIEKYMEPFYLRTDKELFATLCRVTRQITPSVISNFRDLLETAFRSFYVRELSYGEDQANERKTMEFEKMLEGYAGGIGLDKFYQERLLELQAIDPNAWIVQEWKDFDNVLKYAEPYPFEIPSDRAVDFLFEVGDLQYLTALTYIPGNKPLSRYTCYQKGFASVLTQMEADPIGPDLQDEPQVLISGNYYHVNGAMWFYQEFRSGLADIKARRAGYRRDLQTNGETFVWPWEAAEPSLDQSLKIVSELQLTAAHVAFPITVRIGDPCPDEGGCGGSGLIDGNKCNTCQGTGKKKWSTSSIEEIVVNMPDDLNSMPDLSKLLYYVSPDVSILTWQQQYKNELLAQARRDFIGNDSYDQNKVQSVSQTATETILTQQNKNNPVYKFFKFYAEYWEFAVYAVADITGKRQGLNAQIFVGKDLKIKTVGELTIELQEAYKTGDRTLILSIRWDILRAVTLDSPADFIEMQAQAKFDPFPVASPEERLLSSTDPNVPLAKRVLNANFGWIFQDIEMDNPGFYRLRFEEQRIIVDAKVQGIIDENQATAPRISIPVIGNPVIPNTQPNTQPNNLPNTQPNNLPIPQPA